MYWRRRDFLKISLSNMGLFVFLYIMCSLTERFLWSGVEILHGVAYMLVLIVAGKDRLLPFKHRVETSCWVNTVSSVERRKHTAGFLIKNWIQAVFAIKMRIYTFLFGHCNSICGNSKLLMGYKFLFCY